MLALPENLDLANAEFLQAWNLIRHTNKSIFLTGKAGTGKSTFLRYICENTKKKYIVLAPTGIAAINVGGVTIHSFFQVPLRPIPPDDPDYSVSRILKKIRINKEKSHLIKALDLLIIDEISMVRPDTIDFIDRLLRAITHNRKEPFGGKQLLLVGDIFQLEPVVTAATRTILTRFYSDLFFFNAVAFKKNSLLAIELKKVYRQSDKSFVEMLDRIRLNRPTSDDLIQLNSRYYPSSINISSNLPEENEFVMTLASRRELVDCINSQRMEKNPNPEKIFDGVIEGEFPTRSLPTDLHLRVKKDEQIILLKNDKDHRWVNGTLAQIEEIEENTIRIKLENGTAHALEREVWENIRYTYDEKSNKVTEDVIGRFIQFPIKAAWALTVHKSQGLTFNKVNIEMGQGAFSAGQTYVALSRCRSLEGLTFQSPISRRDVIVSQGAVKYSAQFNDRPRIEKALDEAKSKILYAEALEAFDNFDMNDATVKTAQALLLTHDLERPAVVKFIAQKLKLINTLQDQLQQAKDELHSLALEYVEMGRECLSIEGAAKAAISNFDKALRLESTLPDAIVGRISSLLQLNRNLEAHLDIEVAEQEKLIPLLDLHILKGELAEKDNHPEEALLEYTAAIKLSKKNPDLHQRIARVFLRLGMDDMAAKHLDKARKYRSSRKK